MKDEMKSVIDVRVSDDFAIQNMIEIFYERWSELPCTLEKVIDNIAGDVFSKGVTLFDKVLNGVLSKRNDNSLGGVSSKEDLYDKMIWDLTDYELSKIVNFLHDKGYKYPAEFCSKFYLENQERIRERLILE
jgi:hypothetical protein